MVGKLKNKGNKVLDQSSRDLLHCCPYHSFKASFSVGRVELDQLAVFAASGDDRSVLQNTNGKQGAVVDIANSLRDGVVASAPDEHISVRVACQDVSREAESQACDVLGPFPLVEQASLARQREAGVVELPEVHVAFCTGHDHSDLERVAHLVSVILEPLSPRDQSHTLIVWSLPSSIAANKFPPSYVGSRKKCEIVLGH